MEWLAADRFWTWESKGSKGWACRFRVGRLQVGGVVMRHRYASGSSDRWVFHPTVVYDRA